MVVIRLARGGAKKRPFYKIVVADSRKPLKGRFIEKMGYYNPFAAGGEISIHLDMERLNHWQTKGAQLSNRIMLLVKEFKKAQAAQPQVDVEKPKKVVKKKENSTADGAAEKAAEDNSPKE